MIEACLCIGARSKCLFGRPFRRLDIDLWLTGVSTVRATVATGAMGTTSAGAAAAQQQLCDTKISVEPDLERRVAFAVAPHA